MTVNAYRKEKNWTESRAERPDFTKRHREKTAVHKPRRQTSEEASPGRTVISDFYPPSTVKKHRVQSIV